MKCYTGLQVRVETKIEVLVIKINVLQIQLKNSKLNIEIIYCTIKTRYLSSKVSK